MTRKNDFHPLSPVVIVSGVIIAVVGGLVLFFIQNQLSSTMTQPQVGPLPLSQPTQESQHSKVDQFSGVWINESKDTGDITRVEIRRGLNNLNIHMWGACSPTDCDWTETTADVSDANDGDLSITWSKFFAVITQQVTILTDGRLRVVSHYHFIDNSGRPDMDAESYFVKQ